MYHLFSPSSHSTILHATQTHHKDMPHCCSLAHIIGGSLMEFATQSIHRTLSLCPPTSASPSPFAHKTQQVNTTCSCIPKSSHIDRTPTSVPTYPSSHKPLPHHSILVILSTVCNHYSISSLTNQKGPLLTTRLLVRCSLANLQCVFIMNIATCNAAIALSCVSHNVKRHAYSNCSWARPFALLGLLPKAHLAYLSLISQSSP